MKTQEKRDFMSIFRLSHSSCLNAGDYITPTEIKRYFLSEQYGAIIGLSNIRPQNSTQPTYRGWIKDSDYCTQYRCNSYDYVEIKSNDPNLPSLSLNWEEIAMLFNYKAVTFIGYAHGIVSPLSAHKIREIGIKEDPAMSKEENEARWQNVVKELDKCLT